MNLLQRSITSNQASSSQPQARATTHKHTSHTTNTHMLFHLNDNSGYGNSYNGGPLYSNKSNKKNAKSGGFPDMQSNFDYYEYFSNYGRLLTSPPQSPMMGENASPPPVERDRDSRSGSGSSTPGAKEDGGSRKFWRRSATPKYQPVKGTDSPEKSQNAHKQSFKSSQSPSSQTRQPSLKQHGSSRKAPSSPSSPTPPVYYNHETAPLVSPPSDVPMSFNTTGGLAGGLYPYRISFIETNVYIPVDLPSSPQHLPHRRMGPNHYFHQEWVRATVQQLKSQFKPSLNQILVNVEKKAKYPFIIFGSPGPGFEAAGPIVPTATSNTLSPELRITDGLYDLCSVLTRPNSGISEDDTSRPLGYIISAFQTFPGEDSEKLEMNWIVWSGANILYKYLPTAIGLRRLIFYKRHDLHLLKLLGRSQLDNEIPIFTYVLICECFNLRESLLPSACSVIDQLRARCCGYSALYINQL